MISLNLSELKQDFYKRFNSSDNFLHFTANGLLCELLGHSDIAYAPSLTFTLSMRVQMFARRIGSKSVNLQEVSSAKAFSYSFPTPPELVRGKDAPAARLINRFMKYNPEGAQILYECSIPEFLPRKEVFFVTLAQSLFKINDIDADMLETAALSCGGSAVEPYLGIIASKKGCCTHISYGTPENLPLPFSGYKIVSAHCTEKDRDRSRQIKDIFNKICRGFPHTGSIADVTPDMFNAVSPYVRDKTALRYMYHLINENARIKSASAALKRCDIKSLFLEMKMSQKSLERFWNLGSENIFLARCCSHTEGVAAARSWKNGVMMIVEEDKIDHAVGMIRGSFENTVGYRPTFCISEPF